MTFSITACLSALWIAWLLLWIIAAQSAVRTTTIARQRDLRARLLHAVFLWAGAALLFFHSARYGVLLRPLWPRGGWPAWTGLALTAAGLGYAGWARIHIGRFWSGNLVIKEDHALVRSGPYAMTRHPIYSGLLLAAVGTALVRGTIGAVAGLALFAVGIVLRIRQEEALLLGHFGDAYRAYRAEVPALVPRPR